MNIDCSQVLKPMESVRGEIQGLSKVINEMEGKLLELAVQRERLIVMRDCLTKGFQVSYPGEPLAVLAIEPAPEGLTS